jgi:rare lipoprotein A
MRKLLAILTVLAVLPLLTLKAEAPTNAAIKAKYSKPWYGQSSWYGSYWNGKKTACGIKYDAERLYAAHPVLPCGTWLRITNTRTGHSEFAKVVDRGPYEEGREIDVSERVARRIDLKKWGVERVKLEVVRFVD